VLYAINQAWMQALAIQLPDWLRGLGFGIGLFSIALVVWAQLELGRQFSPQLQLRQGHHLVTSGPYAHVRHPLYTGLHAFGLSMGLVSASWFFVFSFVASVAGCRPRAQRRADAGTVRRRTPGVHAAHRQRSAEDVTSYSLF
jgi:protein-S-isoprenylcysteine O-methyltransferase Ste14